MDIEREAKPTAQLLLNWYSLHHRDRNLQWRDHGACAIQTALCEGALIQTTPRTLSKYFTSLFLDIYTPTDWLSMPKEEKASRLDAMGLPSLKIAAIDGIACAIVGGEMTSASAIGAQRGVTAHSAAMVALFFGGEGSPCDLSLERVAERQCGDAPRWISAVISAAMKEKSVSGRPPGYEVACAIGDIANKHCGSNDAMCFGCPLRRTCAAEQYLSHPTLKKTDIETLEPHYMVARTPVTVVNLDCCSWEYREVTIEVGMEGGIVTPQMLRELIVSKFQASDHFGAYDLNGQTAGQVASYLIAELPGRCWCRIAHNDHSVTSWVDNTGERV